MQIVIELTAFFCYIYCRSNPGFHLAGSADTPLILIGTGTGIAPLMGLLREMQASGVKRENCLIFGEKRRAEDFLYQEELEAMQQEGVLGELITAFSRDGAEKYYVFLFLKMLFIHCK